MDSFITEDYYRFVYDPVLYGMNTAYWRELNGAATQDASQRLALQAVTIVSKHQYFRGDFVFNLTIPAAPTLGDSRTFGLKIPSMTTKNAAYFQITDTSFTAVVKDSFNGTTTSSSAITWNASWTNAAIEYRILWVGNKVQFFVDGLRVYEVTDRNLVPQLTTIPVFIANYNNDTTLFSYMAIRDVQKVLMPTWETTSVVTALPSKSPSASPSASPSQSPSASVSPSASPSQSPSASPSVSPSVSPSASPSQSPSASVSPSASKSPSVSPSQSPSSSISPSASVSPSQSPSASKSPSVSPSQSPSASVSPSISASVSPSIPIQP